MNDPHLFVLGELFEIFGIGWDRNSLLSKDTINILDEFFNVLRVYAFDSHVPRVKEVGLYLYLSALVAFGSADLESVFVVGGDGKDFRVGIQCGL
jgi:hypothetical protein